MELKNFFIQDSKGNIVVSPTVYVYDSGTTNTVTLLKKDGTALENPFNAGVNGLAQFRVANGEYDVRAITGSGSYTLTIKAVDVSDSIAAASAEADRSEAAAAESEQAANSASSSAGAAADSETNAATSEASAAQSATAAADSETNAAGSAQTALAQADRAESEANRANTYADNAGYVTRQRLAKQSTLNLDFARGKYLIDDGELTETTNASEILSVERASPKWVEGPNGKLREVAPNTIARKWRNGVCQGALIEDEATNLLLWSEDFTQRDWGAFYMSVQSTGEGAPVGTEYYRCEVTESGGVGGRVTQTIGSLQGAYCLTLWINNNVSNWRYILFHVTGGTRFNLDLDLESVTPDDSASSATVDVEIFSSGCKRVSVVAYPEVASDDNSEFRWHLNQNHSSTSISSGAPLGAFIEVAAIQLKEGTSPSSYIHTTDSPVTREGDVVTHNLGGEYNPNGFSVYAEAQQNSDTGSVIFLNNGGLSNSIRVGLPSNGDHAMYVTVDGSARTSVDLSEFSNYTKGDPAKIVLAVDPNNNRIRLTINGETVDTSTSGLPSPDEVRLGGVSANNNNINGTIHDCIMYPRALTASEAEAMTS